MKLAMLTFYPKDPLVVPGGIRMVALNLVQALKSYDDLDIHVVHCHSDIEADRIVSDGNVMVHYLAMPRMRLIPNLVRSIGRLDTVLQEMRPDLVHAHTAHFAYAAIRAGLPTILTIHGVLSKQRQVYSRTLYDRLRYGLLAFYEKRALPRVRCIVAISPYVVQEYAAQGSVSWVRIDNPVPPALFEIPDQHVAGRILYVGSIDERKDLLTLLRSLKHLRSHVPKAHLRIAGQVNSEHYEGRVRHFVHEQGLDDAVQFLGLLDRKQLYGEYARCAIVALASLEENAPMAVIEAMAAGKPVVATRIGGIPDLVKDGETGYLIEVGDDAALAARIEELLCDATLARSMGRRAREVARERFSAARIAEQYYRLYQDILDKR